MSNITRSLAGWLAGSWAMQRGRTLMEANRKNWNLPMSKLDKLFAGTYLIATQYSSGLFPPKFDDRAAAHEAERQYLHNQPGVNPEAAREANARKPFWNAHSFARYSRDFGRLLKVLENLGLVPGNHLLELGCGGGWMASFLAVTGYNVLATTIGGPDIETAARRKRAFEALDLSNSLRYDVSPMEEVDRLAGCLDAFDAVYVYEALHHAFSWQEALQSALRCLRPGGWLVVASEPNALHTFISYRAAYLAGTHEVGFSRSQLVRGVEEAGFENLRFFAPAWNNLVSPFWLAARRPQTPAARPA